jgi:hypothetical protein
MRSFHGGLIDACRIRSTVRRWVVGNLGTCAMYISILHPACVGVSNHGDDWKMLTFRTTPTSLSNVEAATYGPRVRLAALHVDKTLLCLDNRTWFALVVYTQHLTSDLEFSAL